MVVVVVVVCVAEPQRGAAAAHLHVEPAARPAEGSKPRSERAAGRRGRTPLRCEAPCTPLTVSMEYFSIYLFLYIYI